jgi:regulator of sirC expression with transglutaminase-like and TPR domain
MYKQFGYKFPMKLNVSLPTPLEYFARLVESDDEFPLLEAAAALAHDAHPGLDTEQVLGEVDALAARLRTRVPAGADPQLRLGALNQLFFQELKFGLNRNDYYDPDNSFVHRVLASRKGIPISLAVLWLELAQGIGLKALGVGFPGHFLVSVQVPQGLVVIDPATGESLGREQLGEHLDGLAPTDEAGHAIHLDVDAFLKPSTPREILARMLRNLREIYVAQNNPQRLLGVLDRLVLLLPQSAELRRERGLLHDAMGHAAAALDDLAWYLRHGEADAHIAERVAQLRWMLE